VPDPAAVQDTDAEQRKAFREAYVTLENRIKLLVALPIEKLDRLAIKRNVDEIGRRGAAPRMPRKHLGDFFGGRLTRRRMRTERERLERLLQIFAAIDHRQKGIPRLSAAKPSRASFQCRQFYDLDAILEFDALGDFRQLVFAL
jgi:hypothetical protein